MRKTVTVCGLVVVFLAVWPAPAGEYQGLVPGESTKADADRALGAPLREVVRGVRFDFPPDNDDTLRLSVTVDPENGVIRSIDVHPRQSFGKAEYAEWFELGEPERTEINEEGNLVESYPERGMELHYDGPDDKSAIRWFRHYAVRQDPPPPAPATAGSSGPAGGRPVEEYVADADRAIEAEDWDVVERIVEEGLQHHPNSADLWHSRASYLMKGTPDLPADRRRDELLRAVTRVYELEPTPGHAAELGWIHYDVLHGCGQALYYFEKAEADFAEENPVVLFYMADCYERTGRPEQARAYFRDFLERAPEHEKADEARWRSRD